MPEIFTGEWARDWCRELAESEAYGEAAADWEGALVLTLEADPARDVPDPRSVYLDLHRGDCRGARLATDEDLESAPYRIRADLYTWRQVLEGELEPLGALARGRLKLERGSMVTLARYVRGAQELVEAARRVESAFPGESAPDADPGGAGSEAGP